MYTWNAFLKVHEMSHKLHKKNTELMFYYVHLHFKYTNYTIHNLIYHQSIQILHIIYTNNVCAYFV